jgi:hypothetical protein
VRIHPAPQALEAVAFSDEKGTSVNPKVIIFPQENIFF